MWATFVSTVYKQPQQSDLAEREVMINQDTAHKEENEVKDEPFPLTERDKIGLNAKDEDFELHTWDALREAIETNHLEILQRTPSQITAYINWCRQIIKDYGSISAYITTKRLPWGPPPFTYNSPVPLSDPSDYKILINDWPYGFTPEIRHIVVWSKTPIATDPSTGDMTPDSRNLLGEFVERTFVDRLGRESNGGERVLWFKNWVHLQSVRALEHFHVLVRGASEEDIKFWTSEKQGRK